MNVNQFQIYMIYFLHIIVTRLPKPWIEPIFFSLSKQKRVKRRQPKYLYIIVTEFKDSVRFLPSFSSILLVSSLFRQSNGASRDNKSETQKNKIRSPPQNKQKHIAPLHAQLLKNTTSAYHCTLNKCHIDTLLRAGPGFFYLGITKLYHVTSKPYYNNPNSYCQRCKYMYNSYLL